MSFCTCMRIFELVTRAKVYDVTVAKNKYGWQEMWVEKNFTFHQFAHTQIELISFKICFMRFINHFSLCIRSLEARMLTHQLDGKIDSTISFQSGACMQIREIDGAKEQGSFYHWTWKKSLKKMWWKHYGFKTISYVRQRKVQRKDLSILYIFSGGRWFIFFFLSFLLHFIVVIFGFYFRSFFFTFSSC